MSEILKLYHADKGGEHWYIKDIDEVICSAIETYGPPQEGNEIVVFVGDCKIKKASDFLNDIVDMVTESAHQECGEVTEDWLQKENSNKLQEAMENCIDDWCDSNGETVTFGCIENIKPIHINILKIQGDDVKWAYRDTCG